MKVLVRGSKFQVPSCLLVLVFVWNLGPGSWNANAQALVTISDTLRNADNSLASGRLEITWPAFKTADGFTVAGGRKNQTVTSGVVNLQLFPNAGATPAGTSYTVDYYLTSGAGREYWVVPATGPVTIANVRVTVAPLPSIVVNQSQLTLGTGLSVLLGLSRWAAGAQPTATTAGQCFYDTTADRVSCSNNALAFNTLAAPADIGIKSLNSLTMATQVISPGTSGTDFNIAASGNTHVFNLPDASQTARGVVTTGTQTFTGEKTVDTTSSTTAGSIAILASMRTTHASGTKPWVEGLEANASSNGAGNVTELAALASYAQQSGTGTVTDMFGLHVQSNLKPGAGGVTNNYGIRVKDQAITGANNWAIKTGTGKVEFGDTTVAKVLNGVRVADQFTGANGGAKIQAAVNDCPATKCTVFVPAGTYSITSFISISGKTNFALILDKGAVLQAVSGIGANPILQVEGASTDVLIEGGVFDANSIASIGIQIAATATRVRIEGVEIKNTPSGSFQPGISVASTASGGYEVNIYDSYIHDTFHSCIFTQYPGVVRIERNRCENVSSTNGIQGGGQQLMQVVNNKVSGVSNAANGATGIYCFGCDRVDWRGNEITNSYRGMHCDTCGAGNVRGNLLDNLQHWGIHVEKGADFSIHDNDVRNTGTTVAADAVVLSGTSSTSINALDSTTGLTASANVTLTADLADKQEGTGSVKAEILAAFTTGLVFFHDFGANQTSFLNPFKDLWVKTDTALGSGVLSLGTDSTTNCASLDRTVKLPQLPANTWVRLQQYLPSWQYDAQVAGIRCWAITANSDPGAVTLKFDNFDSAGRNVGDVVSNNRVYWPNGTCFKFDNMIGGEVRGNYCEDAGFATAGARNAYVFQAATNPIASGNEVRYTAKGAGQPGQFFNLDATSTVTEVGNRGTNVDTFAAVAAGGKLLRLDPDTAAGGGLTVDGDANTTLQAKSTAAGTPTAYIQGASTGIAVFGSFTNHPLSFRVNQTERASLNSSGVLGATVFDASAGFRVAGAATSGRYLKGDGTNFIVSTGSASGVGACPANQWANAANSDAAPTCAQPGFSNLSGSAALAQLPVGAANQILGSNAGATSQEHKTLATGTAGTDFAIAHSAGTVTFNLPDASATARGAITTGIQTIAGNKTFSSAPTFSSLTAGSVPFIGTGGLFTQDNSKLFWDDGSKRLQAGPRSGFVALQSYVTNSEHTFAAINSTRGTPLLGIAESNLSTTDLTGTYGAADSRHTSGTRTNAIGVEGDVYHSTAGNVTNLFGVVGFAEHDGTGTTTDMAAVVASGNVRSAGTVTNNYGLLVKNQTAGTNNWAIKTGTGKVEFGDLLQIGDGAGNDRLSFSAESTNPTCAAGNYFIWANSTDTRLKKCQNGTITDLDTTSAGGGYDTAKGDSGTATKTGTEALKVAGTSGEISTSAADGTDDTITVSLPATLSTAKTVSALWTFDRGTTSDQAILIAIPQPGAAGQRDSHFLDQRGTAHDGAAGHNADWRRFVDVTSNAGASTLVWQSRIDAGAFTTRASLTDAGTLGATIFDASTGFRVGGAAASGNYLRGDGANFVSSAIQDADIPAAITRDSEWPSATATLTNKTMDAEATGNVVTSPVEIFIPAASCDNATPSSNWDLPTSNAAVDACITGTNTQKGVLDFANGASALTAQITYQLPWDWASGSNIDAKVKWLSATTTNNVVWQIAIACVADAETDDPAFTDTAFAADAAKATANQTNDVPDGSTFQTITTTGSCAAGELAHIRVKRDPAHASDDHSGTARLIGVALKIRRAM